MARAFASPNPSRTNQDQQVALDRILRTTRQDWMLDILTSEPARQAPPARPRLPLPRLAARAFEAQIMAIRCQKVFAA
jgi:hypothetical protein